MLVRRFDFHLFSFFLGLFTKFCLSECFQTFACLGVSSVWAFVCLFYLLRHLTLQYVVRSCFPFFITLYIRLSPCAITYVLVLSIISWHFNCFSTRKGIMVPAAKNVARVECGAVPVVDYITPEPAAYAAPVPVEEYIAPSLVLLV